MCWQHSTSSHYSLSLWPVTQLPHWLSIRSKVLAAKQRSLTEHWSNRNSTNWPQINTDQISQFQSILKIYLMRYTGEMSERMNDVFLYVCVNFMPISQWKKEKCVCGMEWKAVGSTYPLLGTACHQQCAPGGWSYSSWPSSSGCPPASLQPAGPPVRPGRMACPSAWPRAQGTRAWLWLP